LRFFLCIDWTIRDPFVWRPGRIVVRQICLCFLFDLIFERLEPAFQIGDGDGTVSYAMKRMYPQALAEYDKIAEPDKAVTAENQLVADGLGWVYAVAGRRDDALKIAREVENLSSHTYVDYYQLATIYAGLGEREEVFRLLEKGYQERSVGMLYL
jgi:tetratricopeptide (TPR) repeat protein